MHNFVIATAHFVIATAHFVIATAHFCYLNGKVEYSLNIKNKL